MSKSSENILLLPGETGWEIWTSSPTTGFTLKSATEAQTASELTGFPAGDVILLFPVKAITTVPLKVPTEDEAMFADLATLHIERIGLRPDPLAGQLTDHFVIARENDSATIVSLLLRPPTDADIPSRGPKEFDISSRALPLTGDAIGLWKEFGRWVFAISKDGHLLYSQATTSSSHSPDDSVIRDIRLALIQLSLQHIASDPTKILVWTAAEGVSSAELTEAFHLPVEISPRPTPVLPSPRSKLLPADVRAARRAAQRRRTITLGLAAAAVLYLGVIAWFSFGLWKDSSETKKLLQQAEATAPEAAAYTKHLAKWEELSEAIEVEKSPVDILSRIARNIPLNSNLRLRTAEISANEIKLVGEAPQSPAVNQFSLRLNQSNELAGFTWQTPEPQQSARGWEFVFSAASATPPVQP